MTPDTGLVFEKFPGKAHLCSLVMEQNVGLSRVTGNYNVC